MTRRIALSAAALLLGGSGSAHAAGFALKEQSAAAQGGAFAGATSAAEDASYMFFNPAALGWLGSDHELVAGVTYVAPRLKLSNAQGSTVLGRRLAAARRNRTLARMPWYRPSMPLRE